MSTKLWTLAGVGVLVFAGVNLITRTSLAGARIDLTEDRLFTLTEGSRNIASSLSEPVTFEYFYSRALGSQIPQIKAYADRVEEVLEEFARASGGKLELERKDPEPFSEAEDEAVLAGLRAVPISQTEKLYFGLVGENAVGEQEVIPFFDNREAQERFLEYELARILVSLDNPEKLKVGVVSSLPVMGGGMPMPGQPPERAWLFVDMVRGLFEVEELEAGFDEVPDDVSVLLIVHPKGLSDASLYAIDQYALGGGRVVALVDAWCEAQPNPPGGMQAQFDADKTSDLDPLLEAWGVRMPARKVAGDRSLATRVQVPGRGGTPEPVDYLTYLSIGPDQCSESSPVTAQLSRLLFANAGFLEPVEDSDMTFEPLISTTADSMAVELTRVQFFPDPATLLDEFAPSYQPQHLAVSVTGRPETAYPGGAPADADDEPETLAEAAEEAEALLDGEQPAEPVHLTEATEDFAAIVIADVDFLSDRFWTQQDALSQLFGTVAKTADSPDFLLNAIEQLSGDTNLMSIRARGAYERPFARVVALEKDAEQRYRDEKEALEAELQTSEARIAELQQQRDDSGSLFLTPEQEDEIERARKKVVETSKKLRKVQHSLRKDIESLGSRLQLLNVVAVPALVGVAALAFSALRRTRRRRD